MPMTNRVGEPFVMITDSVADAAQNPTELAILYALLKSANRRTGQCNPGLTTIAKLAKVSRETVKRTLPVLEAREVISIEHGTTNRSNAYKVLSGVGTQCAQAHNVPTREPGEAVTRDDGVGTSRAFDWAHGEPRTRGSNQKSSIVHRDALNNRDVEAATTAVDSARHDLDESARAFADDDADAAASQASTVDLAALIAELRFLREAVHGETVTPEQIDSWQRMSRSQIEAGIRLAKGSAA